MILTTSEEPSHEPVAGLNNRLKAVDDLIHNISPKLNACDRPAQEEVKGQYDSQCQNLQLFLDRWLPWIMREPMMDYQVWYVYNRCYSGGFIGIMICRAVGLVGRGSICIALQAFVPTKMYDALPTVQRGVKNIDTSPHNCTLYLPYVWQAF